GPGFYGRPTASGAIYTGDEFTAAHRSWPFGTWVRLRNPANGREVVVQITDRGPYDPRCLPRLCPHPTRELDLSRAAAEALGIVEQGVADLEARVLVWGDGR
ncbi:MAG TPA: septal ring lytic transglycosylase RlpA family protein, partial [Limnochordia bacterium]